MATALKEGTARRRVITVSGTLGHNQVLRLAGVEVSPLGRNSFAVKLAGGSEIFLRPGRWGTAVLVEVPSGGELPMIEIEDERPEAAPDESAPLVVTGQGDYQRTIRPEDI